MKAAGYFESHYPPMAELGTLAAPCSSNMASPLLEIDCDDPELKLVDCDEGFADGSRPTVGSVPSSDKRPR